MGSGEQHQEQSVERLWRRMPWNGKEEKSWERVATEKRNPVNIIFYLVEVISPVFFR